MKNDLLIHQRKKFFLQSVFAFASIFLLLGFIVFRLVSTTMFHSVDEELEHLAGDTPALNAQIQRNQKSSPANGPFSGNMPPNNFQQQVILWSEDGEILNSGQIGNRIYDFTALRLDQEKLDTIQKVSLNNESQGTLTFRSITVKVSGNDSVAYVQILTNTDQIRNSVTNFLRILMICMGIFFVLSILLSFFLSRTYMTPILAAWKSQQQFVENASHELRTPLAIIQSKLESLFTRPQATILDESESVAVALGEVQRLTKLSSDLLLLARSDGGSLILEKTAVSTQQFLQSISAPYQELAAAEEKELVLKQAVERTILIDQERIHQLLVILLDNALKYTKTGDSIVIISTFTDREWQVSVTDTGTGIPEEQQEHVFERFYRGDASRNRETGGNGIGLSIAKWIVTAHGGKLSVKSNQPKGSVFTFSIPLK